MARVLVEATGRFRKERKRHRVAHYVRKFRLTNGTTSITTVRVWLRVFDGIVNHVAKVHILRVRQEQQWRLRHFDAHIERHRWVAAFLAVEPNIARVRKPGAKKDLARLFGWRSVVNQNNLDVFGFLVVEVPIGIERIF